MRSVLGERRPVELVGARAVAFRHVASGVTRPHPLLDERTNLGEKSGGIRWVRIALALHDDGHLTLQRSVSDGIEDLSGEATEDLLVQLRQLAADRDPPVPQRGDDLAEERGQPPRRLEEHDRPRLLSECLQPPTAIAGTPRQEALEHESIGRESGEDEGGDRGGRTRDDAHVDAVLHRELHDPVPRIRDARHPPVRDYGDVLAGLETSDELGRAFLLVPLEHGHQRLPDVEATEQSAAAPRVLRGHERDRRQRLARSFREVTQVPDRRADEVEDAAHGPMVPRSPPPTMGRMAQAHKDYSGTPLPKKLGIREGARVLVAGAPEDFDDAFGALPTGVQRLGRAGTAMDVVLVFVTEERDLRSRFSKLAAGLDPAGRFWVAWPKKASSVPSDLDFDTVQRIGLDAGLVDNKSASITEEFQGLQFVYRLKDRPR